MQPKSVYEDVADLVHQVEQGQTSRMAARVALAAHGHSGEVVALIDHVVMESERIAKRDSILAAVDARRVANTALHRPASVVDVVNTLTTAWAQGEDAFAEAVSARLSLEPPSNTAVSMVADAVLGETPAMDPVLQPCDVSPYRRAYKDGVRALAAALMTSND